MAAKDEVAMFNMKIREEDTAMDYLVDLTLLDQTKKEALCKSFDIDMEKLEGKQNITLFCNNEV